MDGRGKLSGSDTRTPGAFIVAHRAGNDLAVLRRAQVPGVRLIEADLHLFAGRVEVRHLKTVGPIPLLWDRWTLAPPWAPRLLLDELLAAAAGGTELMLDLKGRDRRLPLRIAEALAEQGSGRAVTVCSRSWELLEPLRGAPGVRLVHSVGSARQLASLRRRFVRRRLDGISIHRELLDAGTARELRERAELLMSWPVERAQQARTLAGWGVQGLITTRFGELAPFVAGAPAGAAAA